MRAAIMAKHVGQLRSAAKAFFVLRLAGSSHGCSGQRCFGRNRLLHLATEHRTLSRRFQFRRCRLIVGLRRLCRRWIEDVGGIIHGPRLGAQETDVMPRPHHSCGRRRSQSRVVDEGAGRPVAIHLGCFLPDLTR